MAIRQWLATSFVWRNIMHGAFGANFYDTDADKATPFFQYRVGRYEPGFTLCFPKEPTARQLRNAVFIKAAVYLDKGVGPYLNFHYEAYEDKEDFLQFLKDAVRNFSSTGLDTKNKLTVQQVADWLNKTEQPLVTQTSLDIREEVTAIIRQALENNHSQSGDQSEQTSELLSRFENLLWESSVLLPQASIDFERPSQHLERKLMVLFKLLSDLGRRGKGISLEKLFKDVTLADIASILKLHFNSFKKQKPNTIVKNISAAMAHLEKSPATIALEKALIDYFFEKESR